MIVGQKFFQYLQLLVIVALLNWRVTLEHSTGRKDGIKCLEKEREALLKFKDELIDEYGRFASWGNEKYKDCCKWSGVFCDKQTNHVVELNLHGISDVGYMPLRGNISIWLLEIRHLKYLDLGFNNFNSSRIPHFIGSLSRLQHLDLSNSEFSGEIPYHLGNLTKLQHLDLSNSKLSGEIPHRLGNLIELQHLDLSVNKLQGEIPMSFGNLSSLSLLHLYSNQLTGAVSHHALSNSFTSLDLSDNMFSGTVPQSIGSLSKLEEFSLRLNNFEDTITESHFFNLSQLQWLDLSSNPGISFNISLGWNPPFQLTSVLLSGCKVGPHFPTWVREQTSLEYFDISNSEISNTFPDWFWDLSPTLIYLSVSHNNFHGVIPDLSSKLFTSSGYSYIDLSFNHFNGSLPILPPKGNVIDLSSNRFSGSITNLCNETNCSWEFLDLSNNLLSGRLPDCFAHLQNLEVLKLAHNNFSGKIPSLNVNSSLNLQNNSFTGEIPTSLRNCTSLTSIDLSKNKLTGKIPKWVGDTWTELVFLSLRSNEFFGSIPSNLCHLKHLQVLDFSSNKISGRIPRCLHNLTAMSQVDYKSKRSYFTNLGYESAFVTWKGKETEYINTLKLVKLIDLSDNNLVGDIPAEITSLVMLVGLNISRNDLSGFLPPNIERLKSLDFLDLSRNYFTGGIPTGVSQLDQLGVLDLSFNNLSGKIPQSNHIQTFNASAFEGNPGLCGLPLTKVCPGDEIAHVPKIGDNDDGIKNQEEDEKLIVDGFYISVTVGFVFGFWGICGTLMLNNRWRIAFFNWFHGLMDWLYKMTLTSKIRLRKAYHKFVRF